MASERDNLVTIAAFLSDSILITDDRFRIIYLNRAFADLFGYTLEDLREQSPDVLNAHTPDAGRQHKLYQVLAQGQTYTGETWNRRKDGSTFRCQFRVVPLLDNDGQPYSYVGIQRDVTRRPEEA